MRNNARLVDIVLLPAEGNAFFLSEFKAALEQVDSVLVLPALPMIPILLTDEPRFGGYQPEIDGQPRNIQISLVAPTIRLTIVHEIAHFLDDALGNFQAYASCEPNSPLQSVLASVEQSKTIRYLREYVSQTYGQFSPERSQVLNRLEKVEIWARCFVQYIALRSGDVQLLLDIQVRKDMEAGILQNEQWDWNDFTSIAPVMDDFFKSIGWLR
jgi:hypothetical protein